jgi:hypothetical protein
MIRQPFLFGLIGKKFIKVDPWQFCRIKGIRWQPVGVTKDAKLQTPQTSNMKRTGFGTGKADGNIGFALRKAKIAVGADQFQCNARIAPMQGRHMRGNTILQDSINTGQPDNATDLPGIVFRLRLLRQKP